MPYKDLDQKHAYDRAYKQRSDVKERRRKPCRRCGGPKGPGRYESYCPSCKAERKLAVCMPLWGLRLKPEPKCRSCGAEAVHLHHAIPLSKCSALRYELLNGLPLCRSCHSRWHAGHPIRQEVFTEEEWACLSAATITGWVTAAWLEKHYPSAASIRERALVAA